MVSKHAHQMDRFKSFLSEPPCTSFSAAAHPSVRSYSQPLGYNRLEEKTLLGNTLAFRSFALLKVGYLYRRPCGKEQPRLSKMCWTTAWHCLLQCGFEESVVASCQFGSPHRKEFRMITYMLDKNFLEVRCPGGHDHVPIAGSAVYVDALGRHFAIAFVKALEFASRMENEGPLCEGIESVIVNDLLAAGAWEVSRSWNWRRSSHINILEASTVVSLLKELALKTPDRRQVVLSDSRVAKGALAKGRSSAATLQRQCQMSGALQTAAGLYPGFNFAPTRLNTADDPTRSLALRSSASHSILDFLMCLFACSWIFLMCRQLGPSFHSHQHPRSLSGRCLFQHHRSFCISLDFLAHSFLCPSHLLALHWVARSLEVCF